MSGVLKGVGKAFKSVVKVAKKIALPALAIGAVVLTGGAALGVLPALGGAGGLLASVGIKGALAGILTSAAKAATFGAIGAALTGGNIVKGATKGFLVGGALGAVGALAAPAAAAAAPAAAAGTNAATTAATTASTAASALPPVAAGSTFSQAFAPVASGGLGTTAAANAAGVAASAAPVASMGAAATAPVVSSGGGLGGFLGNMNPIVQGQMIQGIGGALSANADSKDRRREYEQRQANYGDTSGLFTLDRSGLGNANLQPAAQRYDQAIYGRARLRYDPATGQVVAVGG